MYKSCSCDLEATGKHVEKREVFDEITWTYRINPSAEGAKVVIMPYCQDFPPVNRPKVELHILPWIPSSRLWHN